jgi:serine/threonine protein kinase
MNIFQLIPHISSNEAAIQFLREREILRSLDHPPLYPICHEQMKEARRQSTGDGVTWRCDRRIPNKHRRQISIRQGRSFFILLNSLKNNKFRFIPFQRKHQSTRIYCAGFIVPRIYCATRIYCAYTWSIGLSNAEQEIMASLSTPTVIDWNQFLRDICSQQLIANPIHLGGVGQTVQIGIFNANT